MRKPEKLHLCEINFEKTNSDYKEQMLKRYKNLSKSESKHYDTYIKIRESAKTCPYCGIDNREVDDLDHFFAKSQFPVFSVTPMNLVPSCSKCNRIYKKDEINTKINNMILHPYFDTAFDEIYEFLECKIIQDANQIGVYFDVKKLEHWDDVTYNKVKNHLKLFKLNKRFDSEVSSELSIFLNRCKIISKSSNGEEKIKEDILISMNSCEGINPWKYIMFKSLLNNEWFFDVYLKNI